jgi:hypothetical protein
MYKRPAEQRGDGRPLDIDEIRLVSDLRIMHSKVDELYQIVSNLKRRHNEADVRRYADEPILEEDISRVDQIYLWFVSLKEEGLRRIG